MGVKDILVGGARILAIEDHIQPFLPKSLEVIDIEEQWVFPGFIDSHIHFAGAGGEGGPASRSKELSLAEIVAGGITTAIGCLGTDGIVRSVESVLMKAKALRAGGMSAWMYTGSYQIPPPSILQSPARDIAIIDEVIGIGEIAVADHRSSYPTIDQFIAIGQEARLGGMLGGKAGILNIHIGDAGSPFQMLYEAVKRPGISVHQFLPTHCNRSRAVFDEAKQYGLKGYVDITCSSYPHFKDIEIKPSDAFKQLLEAGVPATHITMSTDAGGSLPRFDENGHSTEISYGKPVSLLNEVLDIIDGHEAGIESALATVTKNVAAILDLHSKGEIAPGKDADLIVVNPADSALRRVMAMGRWVLGV
jgi:beta-aspartyl-dipeptidase (metallo-type)